MVFFFTVNKLLAHLLKIKFINRKTLIIFQSDKTEYYVSSIDESQNLSCSTIEFQNQNFSIDERLNDSTSSNEFQNVSYYDSQDLNNPMSCYENSSTGFESIMHNSQEVFQNKRSASSDTFLFRQEDRFGFSGANNSAVGNQFLKTIIP